jgi:MFS family permease
VREADVAADSRAVDSPAVDSPAQPILPTDLPARADIRPNRTLWLLAAAHAVNHAQAALLPLVYLTIITEFGVSVAAIAFLTAVGNILSGLVQLSYSAITRYVSRRVILTAGGMVFGGFMAAMALANSFLPFSVFNVLSRIGGSPQHPVGNGLIAEQFPPARQGLAISAHIAGGNVGSVIVPVLGGAGLIVAIGWRWYVVAFGIPAMVIAALIFLMVRETGADRAAAKAYGSLRSAMATVLRDRNLRLVYLSAAAGGGARGLGVLNIFVPLYLSLVLHLDDATAAVMYAVLVIGSVPGPMVAGWLSDRLGRKPLILAAYIGGVVGLALFVLAGTYMPMLWLAIVLMGIFNFVESPQLQALLADLSPPALRDASFAVYFTLAFGVGSLWVALYGIVDTVFGNQVGLPITFWLMALAFVAASFIVLPIKIPERVGKPVG